MRESVLFMQNEHADEVGHRYMEECSCNMILKLIQTTYFFPQARRNLQSLAQHTQALLQTALVNVPYLHHLPPSSQETSESLGFLSPIIPVLTRHPRPLSKYLISKGYLVRPIAHPT